MSRLLLIDDNEVQHEFFRCYAMYTDFEFSHAVSMDQAVEVLKKDKPDLIFLDNRLTPFPDFRKTVPILRKAGYNGRIVVISSDVQHPIFEEARKYSIHAYVNKFEITLSNFVDTINSFLTPPAKQKIAS